MEIQDQKIKIFITGGTLDKKYDPLQGKLVLNQTHMPLILDQARCRLHIVQEVVLLKDSLELNSHDRDLIAEKCSTCKEDRIVIAHGTDGMAQTGQKLYDLQLQKCIVLFGAMIPYAFSGSDTLFNLGSALSAVQLLNSGVFVTMNGRIFQANNVYKDQSCGDFKEWK